MEDVVIVQKILEADCKPEAADLPHFMYFASDAPPPDVRALARGMHYGLLFSIPIWALVVWASITAL